MVEHQYLDLTALVLQVTCGFPYLKKILFILYSNTSASFCTAGCTLKQVSLCNALDNGIIFDPEIYISADISLVTASKGASISTIFLMVSTSSLEIAISFLLSKHNVVRMYILLLLVPQFLEHII